MHILNTDSLGSCLRPSAHFPKVSCGPQLWQFKHFPSYVRQLCAAMGSLVPWLAWSVRVVSCTQLLPGTCCRHWGHSQPFFTSDCSLTMSLSGAFKLESSLGKATGAHLGFRISLCYCNAVRKEDSGLMCSNKGRNAYLSSLDTFTRLSSVSSREERQGCSQ